MFKPIIAIILLIGVIVGVAFLIGNENKTPDFKGVVIDKVSEKESDTYINTGGKGGVIIPISGGQTYYIVVENKKEVRKRLPVKVEVYDQFDKGDNFMSRKEHVYKNNELISGDE